MRFNIKSCGNSSLLIHSRQPVGFRCSLSGQWEILVIVQNSTIQAVCECCVTEKRGMFVCHTETQIASAAVLSPSLLYPAGSVVDNHLLLPSPCWMTHFLQQIESQCISNPRFRLLMAETVFLLKPLRAVWRLHHSSARSVSSDSLHCCFPTHFSLIHLFLSLSCAMQRNKPPGSGPDSGGVE